MIWFRSKEQGGTNLFCDNPQCRRLIYEEKLAYDKNTGEIYHGGQCALFATVHRAFETRAVQFGNIDYISRDWALQLYKKGKLKQSDGQLPEQSI